MRKRDVARRIGLGAAALLGTVATAIACANAGWSRRTAAAVRRLAVEPSPPPSVPRGSRAGHGDLPSAVERYFAFALAPDQRAILRARFRQRGTMRAGPRNAWSDFEGVEWFATRPVGFVWEASLPLPGGVPRRVRDSYLDGAGASAAAVAGMLPVGPRPASPQVTASSLLRYLAELPWLPTALLPAAGVAWSVNGDRVVASLSDRGTTVSMDVTFGPEGQIAEIAAMRYRDVGGTAVLTPWRGRYAQYRRIEGMMIPSEAEVSWSPPEGRFAVWRGRIVDADYTFAPDTLRRA